MDNKAWIFITAGAAVVILLLLGFLIFGRPAKGDTTEVTERTNTLKIAKRYYEKGEYDRALNQLDELLKKNIDDKEALELQDMVIDAKNQKEQSDEEAKAERDQAEREKLFSSVNNAIERRDEKPVIIRKETPESSTTNTQSEDNTKENEKKKLLNKYINDGIDEYNNQNYTKAKSNFMKALEIDPDNAEANAALAAAMFDENPDDNKTIEDAVNRAQKALKNDPNSELAHLTLAKIYNKRGMVDQAIDEYKKSVQLNPNNYDAFYNLGKLYFKNKDYKKARESFSSAVAVKKDFVNAFFYLGLTHYKLNNKNDAIAAYNNAIKIDPQFFEAYMNIGEIYRLDSDYTNAINYYKTASSLNNKYLVQKKIGECYEALKKYDDAADSYLLSISINTLDSDQDKKNASECYVSIANIRNIQKKYSEALDYVKKGIAVDANNPNLYFMGGFASDQLNDSANAETYYLKALSLNPAYSQGYINLSSIYNRNGKYSESADLLAKGISVDNSNYMLYNNLGDALQKLTKYDDAIDSYKKAITLNSTDPVIYFNLGLCFKSVNNQDNAAIVLKKAIDLNKAYYDAYYELGESYFLMQKYPEAKQAFTTLLSSKPDYAKRAKIDSMMSIING